MALDGILLRLLALGALMTLAKMSLDGITLPELIFRLVRSAAACGCCRAGGGAGGRGSGSGGGGGGGAGAGGGGGGRGGRGVAP